MSSHRTFSQQSTLTLEKTLNRSQVGFADLLDLRQVGGRPGIGRPNASFSMFVDQDQGLALSGQFRFELVKLRHMLDRVSQSLNFRASQGWAMRVSSVDQVYFHSGGSGSGTPNTPWVHLLQDRYEEQRTFTYQEMEHTNFSTKGKVNTSDGRTIDFSYAMNLGRSFFHQDELAYTAEEVELVDPLVINLDTAAPRFSEILLSLDINMDGQEDQIPAPMPGSGFLCLDQNGDGIINDGSELFGPSTGEGFDELAAYDLDQNNWIDENDDVFDDLSIWESDDKGQMHLTRIKDAGIGAICLANVPTSFDIRNDNNELQARIESTGIALNEDGSVASVQELDFTG